MAIETWITIGLSVERRLRDRIAGLMDAARPGSSSLLTCVNGDVGRILPFHEAAAWSRFPSREFDDGLHVAEMSPAGGHPGVLADPYGSITSPAISVPRNENR